jgi:hypothetical protein
MAHFEQADFRKIKTIRIAGRKSKVRPKDFARIFDPGKQNFHEFIESLPDILLAKDLRDLVSDIVNARRRKKPVILLMGAHVVKVGLSPLVVDLLRRGVITCVAMNGAAAIHDVETALWGKTSEDVGVTILDGSFGMSRETGEFINGTLGAAVADTKTGYGEALGKALRRSPNRNVSILAACAALNIPATVHAAIGTDIVHQQPTMNGAVTGEMSFRDFRILCNVLKKLGKGGVVLNIGSAVILPEVFLKALTVARNLGAKAHGFTTANFDMLRHYRPTMNIVLRPTQDGGKGYSFTGHHEIMVPLLSAMIRDRLKTS